MKYLPDKIWCKLTNDVCIAPDCKYARCVRNLLTSDGLCAAKLRTQRRREEERPEDFSIIPGVRVEEKVSKKLGFEF